MRPGSLCHVSPCRQGTCISCSIAVVSHYSWAWECSREPRAQTPTKLLCTVRIAQRSPAPPGGQATAASLAARGLPLRGVTLAISISRTQSLATCTATSVTLDWAAWMTQERASHAGRQPERRSAASGPQLQLMMPFPLSADILARWAIVSGPASAVAVSPPSAGFAGASLFADSATERSASPAEDTGLRCHVTPVVSPLYRSSPARLYHAAVYRRNALSPLYFELSPLCDTMA